MGLEMVVGGSPWALPSPPFPTFEFECVAMTFDSLALPSGKQSKGPRRPPSSRLSMGRNAIGKADFQSGWLGIQNTF